MKHHFSVWPSIGWKAYPSPFLQNTLCGCSSAPLGELPEHRPPCCKCRSTVVSCFMGGIWVEYLICPVCLFQQAIIGNSWQFNLCVCPKKGEIPQPSSKYTPSFSEWVWVRVVRGPQSWKTSWNNLSHVQRLSMPVQAYQGTVTFLRYFRNWRQKIAPMMTCVRNPNVLRTWGG